MNDLSGITVYLESLGCAKNLVDSEVMLGLLQQAECSITTDPERADALIVNTCGFIEEAQQESINTILRLAEYRVNGNARALVIAGCLAQRFAEELKLEIPEIDAVVGTGEFNHITKVVIEAMSGKKSSLVARPAFIYDHQWPRILSTPGHYAYVKVAEGCDNRCSYCAIPDIRGPYRSRELDSIVCEVENLAKTGCKEIILIAQDTSRYGEDLYGSPRLAELLRRLSQVPDISWIRWLYGYPTRITDELIQTIAEEPKVCPYIDLPLQHISPNVLRRMHRPADDSLIRRTLKKLRDNIPDLALRTTFMVGFPGETEEDFQMLLDFVSEIEFDRLGVFKYSSETGTPAAIMEGGVPPEVKEQRYEQLMLQQQSISLRKNKNWIGRTVKVITDGFVDNRAFGRSRREAPEIDGLIYFSCDSGYDVKVGDITSVKINSAGHYDLMGEAAQ